MTTTRVTTPTSTRSPRPRTSADQVVLALGESREMSGEAESRTSNSTCPVKHQQLIDAVKATGKPFAVVIFNGRPLTLGDADAKSPGNRSRPGSPASRQATRWPTWCSARSTRAASCRCRSRARLGQVPIYYNHEPTGRPCDATQKYDSRYRDLNSCDPLYPFGYGLSYTSFSTSNLQLDKSTVAQHRHGHGIDDRHEHRQGGRHRCRAVVPARPGGQHLPAGAHGCVASSGSRSIPVSRRR